MCSLCRLPVAKNHSFWQILTLWGAPVPTPFYRWGSNLVCYSRPTVYTYLPNFVSIGLFCRPLAAKTPQFLPFFWTSAFSDVANRHQSQKVEHGCATTNLPPIQLSNGIKIFSVLQRFHGEIGRTNSDVQKRDGQTNRQTKNSTFWNPSPTKLGMVIEDIEHVLAPPKFLGSDA